MRSLDDYRRVAVRLGERHRAAVEEVNRGEFYLQVAEQTVADAELAQDIVQEISRAFQQRVHERIAGVVTTCLNAVFDEPYEFSIRFDSKRGKTEARMVFARDGVELDDPLNEIGGGVVDVVALALRLSCLLLSRPPLRRVVFLDEPFRFVRGEENKARTRRMMERLADDLGFQFVVNTDIRAFQIGKVVEL